MKSRGPGKTVPVLALLSFCVLISAYYAGKYYRDRLREKLDETLVSLLKIEDSIEINSNARVAIGYGSCFDIIAPASDMITSHAVPPQDPSHHASINELKDLEESFALYFKHGAAAE